MENQINAGDQNVQQIGQNPVSQPVQIPEKPKINYWMISTIVLMLFILFSGVYYYASTKMGTKVTGNNPQTVGLPQQQLPVSNNQENDFSDYVLATKNNKLFLENIVSKESHEFSFNGAMDISGYQYAYDSVFSPDKKWALLTKDHNIWKTDRKLSTQKQLTTQGKNKTNDLWGVETGGPKWSPDGMHIYYSVSIALPGNDAANPGMKSPTNVQEGIWIMDQDGSNQKYLPQVKQPLGWMPNSKEIMFNGTDANSAIKAFNIDGGNIRNLIHGNTISDLVEDISWSKDGKVAVYTSKNNGSYLINDKFEMIDNLSRQRGNVPADLLSADYTLEFWESHVMSPNGKFALVTKLTRPYTKGNASDSSYDFDHKVEVYLWDTASKQQTKLPIYFSLHTKPFWTADGNKIVYVRQSPVEGSTSVSGERGDIFVYDLISQQESKITSTKDFDPFYIEF